MFNTNDHQITSFKAWKALLLKYPNCIYDEYGKKHNVRKFLNHVKKKQKDRMDAKLHYEEYEIIYDHPRPLYYKIPEEAEFICPDGYRFSKSSDFC